MHFNVKRTKIIDCRAPYRRLRFRPSEVKYFLKLSADKLLIFKWSQAQVYFFFNSYESAAQLKFWFQTDLVRENSASYYKQGCFWLCSPRSRVDHARRPIFMLWLVKIWQVSSCGKFMQHLESCWILLSAEADRVLCQVVMFLTLFFDWMYKMKFSCYQEASVIHG